MIQKLSTALVFALITCMAFGQQNKIPFEKYGVAEGLPEEVAITPIQDDKGFIWFGTQNGLVKYDGYSFKVFRVSSDKTDSTSLQIRSMWGGLLKARDGKIWMAGESSGVSAFDPVTEKFQNFYPAIKDNMSSNEMTSYILFEDIAGNIWFNAGSSLDTQNSTYSLNPTTGIITEYPVGNRNRFYKWLKSYLTTESSGTVWLLDDKNNLQRLNREIDSFEIIIPAGKNILLSGYADTISRLDKAGDDRLLLTGAHGLYFLDTRNQKIIKSYVHEKGNANSIADSIGSSIIDVKGQIWLAHTGGKISLIDTLTDNIQTYTYGSNPLPYYKGIQKIYGIIITAQNDEGIFFELFVDQQFPIFFIYYDYANKTFSYYDYNFNLTGNPLPQHPYPYEYLQDHTGLLWLATRPGLYKQAPKKQQMDLFRFNANDPDGLPSDTIRYLFEDSKKRLWVGTINGLAMYQPDMENFKVFRNNPSNANSISNNAITTVYEDPDGKIWIGTENGLNLLQESTGNFKRFFYSASEVNNIRFLFPDNQKRLWLSIFDKGVYVLDFNTGKILKSYLPDNTNPSSLSSNKIDAFYQDSRDIIWLGDRSDNEFGLYKLNPAGDGFTHYLPVPGDSTSISSNEISFIVEDGKKNLWIGTDGGLNLYDYNKNKFTVFRSKILSSTNYFVEDKNGELWFGTYSSGGLVHVNADQGILTAYDESKGLLQNDISNGLNGLMAKDQFGKFWLPTQRGLSVFDPETKSFVAYFEKDGFQPYSRRYVAIATSNGDIWIGGYNGLNRIVPANLLKKDTTLPAIVITQVTINNTAYSKPDGSIFKQSVAYTQNIELQYWQKDLSFDFVALHYLRSEDNLYSWKLENYDQDWTAPSKDRKASYTNLSPGKYIFRVRASNADGVWNEEGVSITITILPPWWRTWWAYTIYVLLFLFALRVFSKWRERRLRHDKEKLQVKVEERTSELKKSLEELKSTQSQLVQSEKMASLGELTAGIAHEIQNPLNFVNNFSEVNKELVDELQQDLKDGKIDSAIEISNDIRENEEKINHHGKRADAIVKSMLQHSRTSSGQKELTDINALCDEYLRLSYHGLRAKDKSFNAKFEMHPDSSIPKVNVVVQDIGRVILNLINNAFYAVDERKKSGIENLPDGQSGFEPIVTISTKKLNGKIEISIKDNGNGIPDAIKEKIFQPFFTTKPTGQGTGLGLSLSYDIVKAHGGELKVETHVGKGTVFTIVLPVQ